MHFSRGIMLLHEDECHEVYNLILLRVMSSSSSTQDLHSLTVKIAGEDLAQFPFSTVAITFFDSIKITANCMQVSKSYQHTN